MVFDQASEYLFSGWRGRTLTLAFLLLSLAVVVMVIITNWKTITTYEWQIRPVWIGYGLIFLAIDLFLGALAWHLLVIRFTDHKSLRYNVKFWSYANLARRIPGTIWYISSRAVLYERRGIRKTTTIVLSGLEMALILVSGIVMFIIILPFWALPDHIMDGLMDLWFLFILLPPCLLLVHPRVLDRLWRKISPQTNIPELRWSDTIGWLFLYLVIWGVGSLTLFSAVNLVYPLPIQQLSSIIGMWALASTISLAGALTFTSFGVREISLTLLLAQLIPAPIALIVAITVRIFWLAGEWVGGVLSLLL